MRRSLPLLRRKLTRNVWPPPQPPPFNPLNPLPQGQTSVTSFSSSSPLHPDNRRQKDADDKKSDPASSLVNSNVGDEDWEVGSAEGEGSTGISVLPTRASVLAKRRAGGQKFLDYIHLSIRGGTGGDGAVAFDKNPTRRDHRGGPSGGTGGEGGDIFIQSDDRVQNLASVARNVQGNTGFNGSGKGLNGKKGEPIIIKVPPGTMIRQISRQVFRPLTPDQELLPEETRLQLLNARLLVFHPSADPSGDNAPPITPAHRWGTTIHGTPLPPPPPIEVDLSVAIDEPILMARGGRGGEGNRVFGRHEEKGLHLWGRRGEVPDTIRLELELRLLADVGLLGAPNAGKSTLLEALTASKPRIAAHKFTTLNPYVGVCRILDDGTIVSSPSATASSVPLTTPEQAVHFDKPILPTQSYAVRESLPDTTRHKRSLFGQRNRVSHEDEALRFRICDNPGLIPESHLNKGLGHHFLLSVSRSPILCLVLDFTLPLARLIEQAEMIVKELDHFEPESKLRERIRIVVGNKADEVKDEVKGRKRREGLSRWVRRNLGPKEKRSEEEDGEVTTHGRQEVEVKLISGKWGLGIRDLAFTMGEMVVERREKEAFEREERRRKVREEEEEIVRELQKKILKFTDVPPRGLGEEDVGFGLLAPPRDMMEGVEFVGGQGKKKVGGNQEDGVESGEEEEEGEGERNRTEDGKGEEKT